MQENLVIVESPAKAKTIEKFLGKDYIVKSRFGHIRDLSKKDLGINIDDEFKPVYEIPGDKKKVVDELTKLAKSKTVWLASDEDREGEAIAWHLTEVLGLPVRQTQHPPGLRQRAQRLLAHRLAADHAVQPAHRHGRRRRPRCPRSLP